MIFETLDTDLFEQTVQMGAQRNGWTKTVATNPIPCDLKIPEDFSSSHNHVHLTILLLP